MRISDWSSDVCSSDLANLGLEFDGLAIGLSGGDADFGRTLVEAIEVEHFSAIEAEALRGLAVAEVQRQHAHAHQVCAMDALDSFRDDRLHAPQAPALGRPVARRARAVCLSGPPALRLLQSLRPPPHTDTRPHAYALRVFEP